MNVKHWIYFIDSWLKQFLEIPISDRDEKLYLSFPFFSLNSNLLFPIKNIFNSLNLFLSFLSLKISGSVNFFGKD